MCPSTHTIDDGAFSFLSTARGGEGPEKGETTHMGEQSGAQADLARVLDFGSLVEGVETAQITANLSGGVLEIIQPRPRATAQQSQKIASS